MGWKVTTVRVKHAKSESGLEALKIMLADGYWEPFAVTMDEVESIYYLRNRDDAQD